MTAIVKPAQLKTLSTLDPLVTNMSHLDDEAFEELEKPEKPSHRRTETFLARAARMLQGEPSDCDDGHDKDNDSRSAGTLKANDNALSPARTETGEMVLMSNAAATLDEGALPVREFPGNLMSEPASLAQSTNSSVVSEKNNRSRSRSNSLLRGQHQEELRCVVAIIRHGDRTPKQKLKVNMCEPHILKYFHDQ